MGFLFCFVCLFVVVVVVCHWVFLVFVFVFWGVTERRFSILSDDQGLCFSSVANETNIDTYT